MRRLLFAALIVLITCAPLCGAAPASARAPALPEHERLVYAARWLGFPVGTVTASIRGVTELRGRRAYLLEIDVRTNDFCSRIYPINDRYISYLDVETMRPLRHEVYRREGRYRKDAATDFDHDAGKAYFRNFLDRSEKTVDIPAGVQDPVSVAYVFRTVGLEPGERKEFDVYNNEQVYRLYGVAEAKRTVRVPALGAVDAFRIQPYAKLKGETYRKGRASMWISLDARRIPLIGSARSPIFTEITGRLERIE